MKNKIKYQSIINESWDNLIILDACRYDFFKKIYPEFLTGSLEKRRSKGSATEEWLAKTFTKRYDDIIYYSTNTYVNGIGIGLKDINEQSYEWTATDHFGKIIDVWDFGWDDDLNTVVPVTLNNVVRSFEDDYERRIIHYIQPHQPYLHPEFQTKCGKIGWRNRDFLQRKEKEEGSSTSKKSKSFKKIRDRLGDILVDIFGLQKVANFRKKIGLPPTSDFEEFAYLGILKNIPQYYYYNTKIVIEKVSDLIDDLEGKTIVTADHGESLGENNYWGHRNESQMEVLRIVPWMEIE